MLPIKHTQVRLLQPQPKKITTIWGCNGILKPMNSSEILGANDPLHGPDRLLRAENLPNKGVFLG